MEWFGSLTQYSSNGSIVCEPKVVKNNKEIPNYYYNNNNNNKQILVQNGLYLGKFVSEKIIDELLVQFTCTI